MKQCVVELEKDPLNGDNISKYQEAYVEYCVHSKASGLSLHTEYAAPWRLFRVVAGKQEDNKNYCYMQRYAYLAAHIFFVQSEWGAQTLVLDAENTSVYTFCTHMLSSCFAQKGRNRNHDLAGELVLVQYLFSKLDSVKYEQGINFFSDCPTYKCKTYEGLHESWCQIAAICVLYNNRLINDTV